MLIRVKSLHGTVIRARDGDIGKVDEVLFDDEHWKVRYLIADTGGWLSDRKVLLSPNGLGERDIDAGVLRVNLTREQVKGSPDVKSDEPVSRQWEKDYYDYYAWPYYWGGMGFVGGMGFAGGLGATNEIGLYQGPILAPGMGGSLAQEDLDKRAREHSNRDSGDCHLRSTKEVTGYGIIAKDGRLGHVDDFIVDDKSWRICYLAVDTKDLWPGKKVLLPSEWIGQTRWPDRTVRVEVTQDQVRNAPEWNANEPISRAFEDDISQYYAEQRLGRYDFSKSSSK